MHLLSCEQSDIVLDKVATNELMLLLENEKYQYKGTSSVGHNSYMQIYLEFCSKEAIEVMISSETILINELGNHPRHKIYKILTDGSKLEVSIKQSLLD